MLYVVLVLIMLNLLRTILTHKLKYDVVVVNISVELNKSTNTTGTYVKRNEYYLFKKIIKDSKVMLNQIY